MKIFWSWQLDTPGKLNKYFVKDVLEEALSMVAADLDLSEANRPEIDHDTKGEPGLVSIVDTVFKKIEEAAIFVADVTFVGQTPAGKQLPNPNVMIELGHAITSIGTERIVLVANSAFGFRHEDLPFDLRHRRGPIIYDLPVGATAEDRKKAMKNLVQALSEALANGLGCVTDQEAKKLLFPLHPAQPDDRATWLAKGETVQHHDTFARTGQAEWHISEGARSYLRIVPAKVDKKISRLTAQSAGSSMSLHALGPWVNGDHGANGLGFVSIGMDNKLPGNAIAVAQWFLETSEVWSFNTKAAFARDGENLISVTSIAKEWRTFLNRALSFLAHLGIQGLFLVEAGVTNLGGVLLQTTKLTSVPALNDDVHVRTIDQHWTPGKQVEFLTEAFNALLEVFNQAPVTTTQFQSIA